MQVREFTSCLTMLPRHADYSNQESRGLNVHDDRGVTRRTAWVLIRVGQKMQASESG